MVNFDAIKKRAFEVSRTHRLSDIEISQRDIPALLEYIEAIENAALEARDQAFTDAVNAVMTLAFSGDNVALYREVVEMLQALRTRNH